MCLVVIFCAVTPVASAHVLITDESGKTGAILHINPDDDPVAGEQSNLFFDIQSRNSLEGATLTIQQVEVPIIIDANTVRATYVFPSQGAYVITLKTQSETFVQNQRVSRGISNTNLGKPRYVWAEIALIVCSVGLISMLIVIFNRRREIASRSV